MDTEALKAQLRAHEGVRDRAYRDTRGILTVGVGFNLARPDARSRATRSSPSPSASCPETTKN